MQAQLAELVDALVSNTCGKPCRFDSGAGYLPENIWKVERVALDEQPFFYLTFF